MYCFAESSQWLDEVGTVIESILQIKKLKFRGNFPQVTELAGVRAGRAGSDLSVHLRDTAPGKQTVQEGRLMLMST